MADQETPDHGRLNIRLSQLNHLQLTKHLVKIYKGSLKPLRINFQKKPPKHVAFFNKGNTYFANSNFKCSTILLFSSEHEKILSLSRAVNLHMALLKRKTSPIDPCNFLWASRNKITKDHRSPFNFNSHQHVPKFSKNCGGRVERCISGGRQYNFIHCPNISHLQCLPFVVIFRKKTLI